ncbi:hypothetical protein M9H77_13213 [Catharanthus roseus]|uniref:Uncharacterized protein n=1 Tax=Catharanthus roseus TaxID=4058 RepID=A0ACC0BJV9_CATRO|nr:hypothetical protein M9H77_13213 [Catharanthus roseus]
MSQGLAMVMHKNFEGPAVFEMLDKALEVARREKKVNEERNIRILIGQMYLVKGELEEALASFQALINENPRDFRPYLCQGIVYSLLDRKDEAKEQFEIYQSLVPEEFPQRQFLDDVVLAAKTESRQQLEKEFKAEFSIMLYIKVRNFDVLEPFPYSDQVGVIKELHIKWQLGLQLGQRTMVGVTYLENERASSSQYAFMAGAWDKLQVATLLYSQQAFPSPMCSTCDKAVEFTLHSMRAREWNAVAFGTEEELPSSEHLAWAIDKRVREWRIAWQKKLLHQLQPTLDGDIQF